MSGRLIRDLPHVMHETIDNEVVVVNLTSGVYYSFDGVGVCVWDWIDGSRTIEDIVKSATEHFDGNHEHISTSVRGFLQKLLDENLVVLGSAESGGLGVENEQSVALESGGVVARAFAEPILQKYTDMEALLLADPIHEVDESTGWPHQK
jgi:hypothetical protein